MPTAVTHYVEKDSSEAPRIVGESWLTPKRISQLTWAFVAFGVVIRLCRYLIRFPLWEDEAFLAYSVGERGFAGLLDPLDYSQVAPIGFLWLERALVELFGFNEYSLRGIALVSGLASLFLFRRVAHLCLAGPARVFAVALFAVSYPMLRYSAEAKQYGLDLALSLTLLWFFLEARARPRQWGWQLGLVALGPIGILASHPTVFVAGGISVAWAWSWIATPSLQAEGSKSRWRIWLLFNMLLGAAFFGNLWLAERMVGPENAAFMQQCWQGAFPPLAPGPLLSWLWSTFAGDFLAYPFGAGKGGSTLTLLAVLCGLGIWAAKRRWLLLVLVLAPLALHLTAAALHRFPLGGHVKFGLYWAPAVALFAGTALAALCGWLDRNRAARPVFFCTILGLLAVFAAGAMARDLIRPCKTRSDERGRDLARWLWFDAAHDGPVLCLHRDLGRNFTKDATSRLNWSASFYCNEAIYSPRHARKERVTPEQLQKAKTIRVVEFRPSHLEYDETGQRQWLRDMQQRFELVSRQAFPLSRYDHCERGPMNVDVVEVYLFRPLPMEKD
ncbi:MAG: glycosyltransferase family 39 protein [Gemmataceae bacterium]|nr:glycosyltransferase family 39 protein [Gemmataceae bacterium]MCI0740719.1 glycosyltransferase family 39 protein [Gemmataceae bacterium]